MASVEDGEIPAGYHIEWYSSINAFNWFRINKTTYTSGDTNISGAYSEKVNVALTGGARTETAMTTYRAVLTADSAVPSADAIPKAEFVQSRYYDRIMNGGFENEQIPDGICFYLNPSQNFSPAWVSSDLSDEAIARNFELKYGYTNYVRKESSLIWKTTAPAGVIEVANASKDKTVNSVYGTSKYEPLASEVYFNKLEDTEHTNTYNIVTYEGDQMVELNAEEVGSLYQDIITVPGTDLYWSFMHRARVPSESGNNDAEDSI